jgi:hypothetical protein
MQSRRELIFESAKRYRRASKKDKGKILDSLVNLTGYNRDYASYLLGLCRTKLLVQGADGRVHRVVADPKAKRRRKRKRKYGPEVLGPLRRIWGIMDLACGKRLAPCMGWLIPKLESCGELKVASEVGEKLLTISAATIDRLLAPERKQLTLKGRSHTKPGTLLKHQIPIRTFTQWDDLRPGFTEIDLVDHGGGSTEGEYLFTLNVTDVATGWTEFRAVKNRAQKWTFEALGLIRERMPFPLLGIDSDNDGAFINHHLFRFCQAHMVTFTRSRAGNKNDNCYVEQKNWSVVRRRVGYGRLETDKELELLNALYDVARLYQNFFQPSCKLQRRQRNGAKVTKWYDKAKTPYHRILASNQVDQPIKTCLSNTFDQLNPAELMRRMHRLKTRLNQVRKERQLPTEPPAIQQGLAAFP